MEPYEATRIVYSRVQSLDPENVSKIMGYLLLQENGEQEMFHLAVGSELLLRSIVVQAKKDLGLPSHGGSLHLPSKLPFLQIPPQFSKTNGGQFCHQISMNHLSPQLPYSPHSPINHPSPHFHSPTPAQAFHPIDRFHHSIPWREDHLPTNKDISPVHDHLMHVKLNEKQIHPSHLALQEFLQSMSDGGDQLLPNRMGVPFPKEHFHPDQTLSYLNNSRDTNEMRHELNDLQSPADIASPHAWKPCLYFARGYCKHESSCRFLHTQSKDNSGSSSPSIGKWEMLGDDYIGSAGSLEKLELELQELLRERKSPVSIASLPQLYYERFGKTLQAEGYLTESQRHGKAGYSLTKLLARLRSSVSLIDRPHGQHAVVLAEDAHKFSLYRSYSDEFNGVNPSSRQIYLTFPAESTFTEEDVSSHFRAYGPVQDVRIPYQQKRMFGFVTFVYSETVKNILTEGNPHYICGARVLVKPYREKGKHGDKKLIERGELSKYSLSQIIPGKSYDISALKFGHENDILSMQMDDEAMYELERRQLMEMHIADARRRHIEAEMAQFTPAVQANQSHSPSDVHHPDEFTIYAEEIQHLRSNSAFGLLSDVHDSETSEDISTEDDFPSKRERNGHMLPQNLFSGHLDMGHRIAFGLPEKLDQLNLGEKLETSNVAISASGASNQIDHGSLNLDIESNGRQVSTLYEGQDNQIFQVPL